VSGKPFVPVNEPLLDGNEAAYLAQCVETGWISSEGPFVKKLEEEFAVKVGRRYAVAVTNGSAALEAAVAATGILPGDEVILPTFTIISCAAAIIRAGAVPVLVDCDAKTWNMDVNQVEARITKKTSAIMAVHIFGLPTDMDAILELADRHGLKVIEDAAEAHGQTYNGRPCGSFGDVSTFSFYPNKLVTTGEGGMIVTDDAELAETCRSLRNLCFKPEQRFIHDALGWNFRMTNLQAAVGVAQLERLDEFIEIKRRIGDKYWDLLGGTNGVQLPVRSTPYAKNIYWVFGVVLDDDVSFDAREAMSRMAKHAIGTRPFFWPMHEQPVLQRLGYFADERHPVSEKIARRGFYVPSGLAITGEQIERSAAALKQILA
jgi:perosamine synthetase